MGTAMQGRTGSGLEEMMSHSCATAGTSAPSHAYRNNNISAEARAESGLLKGYVP